MKCPICSGKMEKTTQKMDGVAYEAHRCSACGEELLDMQQLKGLANKFRRLRTAKEVKFSQWGNSIGVRIPKDIASELGIKDGSQGLLLKEKEGLRIIME